jgi:hypothetical protein
VLLPSALVRSCVEMKVRFTPEAARRTPHGGRLDATATTA